MGQYQNKCPCCEEEILPIPEAQLTLHQYDHDREEGWEILSPDWQINKGKGKGLWWVPHTVPHSTLAMPASSSVPSASIDDLQSFISSIHPLGFLMGLDIYGASCVAIASGLKTLFGRKVESHPHAHSTHFKSRYKNISSLSPPGSTGVCNLQDEEVLPAFIGPRYNTRMIGITLEYLSLDASLFYRRLTRSSLPTRLLCTLSKNEWDLLPCLRQICLSFPPHVSPL